MLLENDMKTLQTNKVGRPTAIVPELVAKLENIFKVGANVEEACSYAGINKSTYYRHIESDGDFATKMESAQHYPDIVAKNVVVDKIVKEKDLDTAKWWLEKREFKNTGTNLAVQVNFGQRANEQRNKYRI